MSAQHASIHARFQKQLRDHTITPTYEGARPYVRTRELLEWIKAKHPRDEQTNAQHLLMASYKDRQDPALPITAEKICNHQERSCAIVFCILLEIGLGHLIAEVQREDIIDRFLTQISNADLEKAFNRISSRGTTYAELFDAQRWKYRPLKFDWEMDENFPDERVLPICQKQGIGKGGQAQVFSILVQEEYISTALRNELSKDEHTRIDHDEFGKCFQLALKTFAPDQTAYFVNEKRAFGALRSNKGMIKYLGSFGILGSHTSRSPLKQMNIVLEYGEFDLMGIFRYRSPPVNSPEIENFWTSLIEVVNALKGIHNFRSLNDQYHGWHNDIKPENIIVVDGCYKLADPGFAKFQKRLEEGKDQIPKIIAGGGTTTYGSPERYARARNSKSGVSQTVDLWSIGCVFSLAATWVVLGYQGIYQYQEARRDAINDIVESQLADDLDHLISKGDFFHDGKDLLPVVKEWHHYLRKSLRQTDHVTSAILDFTEANLLIAERRMPASQLYNGLQDILKTCEKESIPEQLEGLMRKLLEIDQKAQSMPSQSEESRSVRQGPSVHVPQRPLQAGRLGLPDQLLKTASRLESLSILPTGKSPQISPRSSRFPSNVNRNVGTGFPAIRETSTPEQDRDSRRASAPPQPRVVTRPSTIHSMRIDEGLAPDPANIFQIRQALEKSKFFSPKVDDYVKHYLQDRDIKFLVDNAPTMEQFWAEAVYLLETLALMAKPFDDDGMDLYLTTQESFDQPYLHSNKEKSFRNAMLNKTPRKGVWPATDITVPIEAIFGEYIRRMDKYQYQLATKSWSKRSKSSGIPKKLTLIVLTDGLWIGMKNPNDINPFMEKLLRELKKKGIIGTTQDEDKERLVSIQFIQFGMDAEAAERLRALDDDTGYKGFQDIIDHEMFSVNGDVRKMLLGSFVPVMDKSKKVMYAGFDTPEVQSPSGPSTRHSMPAVPTTQQHALDDDHLQEIMELGPPRIRTPTNSTGSSYMTPPEEPQSFQQQQPRE